MEAFKLLMTLLTSLGMIIAYCAPIALIIFLIIFIDRKIGKKKNNNSTQSTYQKPTQSIYQQETISPYEINQFLLTVHEANFYKALKPIADKYNLTIFCKVRMADLLNVKSFLKGRNFYKWFERISQKHIDFVLCNNNFMPVILIELDDSSHDNARRKESDDFKNAVFRDTQLKLLRFRNWTNQEIENNINYCLSGYYNTQNQ